MRTREAIVATVGIIVFGIVVHSFITRNRPHVPTTDEIFVTECAKQGGDPLIVRDWDDNESNRSYECRKVEDVRN